MHNALASAGRTMVNTSQLPVVDVSIQGAVVEVGGVAVVVVMIIGRIGRTGRIGTIGRSGNAGNPNDGEDNAAGGGLLSIDFFRVLFLCNS